MSGIWPARREAGCSNWPIADGPPVERTGVKHMTGEKPGLHRILVSLTAGSQPEEKWLHNKIRMKLIWSLLPHLMSAPVAGYRFCPEREKHILFKTSVLTAGLLFCQFPVIWSLSDMKTEQQLVKSEHLHQTKHCCCTHDTHAQPYHYKTHTKYLIKD